LLIRVQRKTPREGVPGGDNQIWIDMTKESMGQDGEKG